MSTYSQMYVHIVFAVKYRESLIRPEWEERLYKYITGIVQRKEQKMLAINGMPDHIHLLIGMRPTCCLSDLVREIKKFSNEFVNTNRFTACKFAWQEGFGSFTYGHWDRDRIIKYVMNQKEHHSKVKFKQEYTDFLKQYEIEYDEKYLFDWQE